MMTRIRTPFAPITGAEVRRDRTAAGGARHLHRSGELARAGVALGDVIENGLQGARGDALAGECLRHRF
jgi:hypothetical protein